MSSGKMYSFKIFEFRTLSGSYTFSTLPGNNSLTVTIPSLGDPQINLNCDNRYFEWTSELFREVSLGGGGGGLK